MHASLVIVLVLLGILCPFLATTSAENKVGWKTNDRIKSNEENMVSSSGILFWWAGSIFQTIIGSNSTSVFVPDTKAQGGGDLAVDNVQEYLYWTNSVAPPGISRIKIDGTGFDSNWFPTQGAPVNLAVDGVNGKVYTQDSGTFELYQIDIATKQVKILGTFKTPDGFPAMDQLALYINPQNHVMLYWGYGENCTYQLDATAGTPAEPFWCGPELFFPGAIAVDQRGMVYIDGFESTIFMAPIRNTTNPKQFNGSTLLNVCRIATDNVNNMVFITGGGDPATVAILNPATGNYINYVTPQEDNVPCGVAVFNPSAGD